MSLFDRRRRSRALARANEALANGDLVEAQQLAEGVLREDSVNLDALLLLGELRLLEGDSDAALAVLERALSEDPENPTVRERLGDVHARRAADARELGNLEECVEAFNDALPYVSDKAFIYYNMGCAYADFHQEHAAEAVEMWRRAIAERPDYTEPHFDLGTALFHSDRFDEALRGVKTSAVRLVSNIILILFCNIGDFRGARGGARRGPRGVTGRVPRSERNLDAEIAKKLPKGSPNGSPKQF